MQMNNLSFKSACCGSRMFYQERKSSEALPMWFCNTRTPGQHRNHLLVVTPIITIIAICHDHHPHHDRHHHHFPDTRRFDNWRRESDNPANPCLHPHPLSQVFSWNLSRWIGTWRKTQSQEVLWSSLFINNSLLPLVRNFPREHNRIVRATRQVVWQEIKKAKLKLKEIVLGIRAEELTFQARIFSWDFSTQFWEFPTDFWEFSTHFPQIARQLVGAQLQNIVYRLILAIYLY